MKRVRKFASSHPKLSKTTSTHWWYSSLPTEEKEAFARVANAQEIKDAFNKRFPGYNLSRVDGMDEIYATGPPVKGTSDEVFYTKHIDGPFEFYRFASVYRCLIGLDDNTTTVTKFPMIPDKITATTGDVFGFDFNKEIHYIEKDPSRKDKDQRIVLKCHYAVSPPFIGFWGTLLGTLNVLYNMLFRALFLKTIRPSTWFEDLLARFGVVGVTKLVYKVEQYVGYNNIMYLALVLANAWSLQSFELWLVCTSFVHYLRYITTYYNRDNIAYEDFKRDVLLFKSIALMNLAYVYLSPFDFEISRVLNEVNPRCLAMIVVGYALSMKATKALGLDRTYFGVELGFLAPKWIDEFPYGTIPHPMIVSQLLALYVVVIFFFFIEEKDNFTPSNNNTGTDSTTPITSRTDRTVLGFFLYTWDCT